MSKKDKKLKKSILRTFSMDEIKQQAIDSQKLINELSEELKEEEGYSMLHSSNPPSVSGKFHSEIDRLRVLEEIINRYDNETKK